jgi:hypothetical protein
MRKTLFGLMIALAAAGLFTAVLGAIAGESVEGPPQVRTFAWRCASWDEAAGRAIAQRAQAERDVNVRLVSESTAGLRRARRLCALGSLADACREYDAVIRGVQSRLQVGLLPEMCRSITLDAPAS